MYLETYRLCIDLNDNTDTGYFNPKGYEIDEKRIKAINGVKYEIRLYKGDHASEYLVSEMKGDTIEGSCQLFNRGILSRAWTIRDGKEVVDTTKYDHGKVLERENWNSIIGKEDRRVIENTKDIFTKFDLEKQIEKMQNRKIWLNCGGFITIDKTEALTAIDVNTGKYTGTKDLEQTIYKVNKEATIEIAKQIRLRDIGGIIIIDYIDMKNEENKKQIEDLLKEELKKDRSKTQVEGFTKLDLMELTRKHICSHRD